MKEEIDQAVAFALVQSEMLDVLGSLLIRRGCRVTMPNDVKALSLVGRTDCRGNPRLLERLTDPAGVRKLRPLYGRVHGRFHVGFSGGRRTIAHASDRHDRGVAPRAMRRMLFLLLIASDTAWF
jgi:hypothetical protein